MKIDLGIDKASSTVAAAVPEVTKAVAGAEESIAADLEGIEKTLQDSLSTAIAAFADGITQVLAAAERIDGGSITISPITISFNFPRKAAQ